MFVNYSIKKNKETIHTYKQVSVLVVAAPSVKMSFVLFTQRYSFNPFANTRQFKKTNE